MLPRFCDLRIGTRLAAAFFFAALLTTVLGLIAYARLSAIGAQWQEYESVTVAKLRLLQHGKDMFGDAIHSYKDYVLRGGAYRTKFLSDLDEVDKAARTSLQLGAFGSSEAGDVDTLIAATAGYRESLVKLDALVQSGASIEERDHGVAGADKPIGKAIDVLIDLAMTRTHEQGAVITQLALYAQRTIVIVTVAALACALLLAYLITRSITVPIGLAVSAAEAVARGDLTQAIASDRADETGRLLRALKDMNESLLRVVGQVRRGADNLATATSQIAAGNQDLSSRTEEQASSLQETATSMEELTSAVSRNAGNAQQGTSLASSATEVAQRGSAVVDKVVATMGEISDRSKEIGEITGIIEGIAFQTNILALNAAVEAARAGDQGRGFAVVAGEVRNLAQRSASAAKEIKELIAASVAKVHDGAQLASDAGTTMAEVTRAVAKVSDIISEIAAASTEQSRGIEQVNLAVAQMDQATQQNAALVEQAAAASVSLHEQGRQLTDMVAFFRLDAKTPLLH
ncbi:MAG TPA: methyl-accepting chemotaxis protein [Trinickia sp.]|uniref:methyl-accepting chemotaxis protein n=1 Tax=Trinickia sp. TaxID=2571163 RepID=UPI002BCFFB87|nr:methyl-accepting chemotaxis protein [Trinickia sp.]HVW49841.1 methyl-accepting chemotaxis protein [Trinickia sp.]